MYTDRIPLELAKELESKGFIAEIGPDDWDVVEAEWKTKESSYSTYAEVFDWLIEEKGIYISIYHRYTSVGLEWFPMVNGLFPYVIDGREWNHSANLAIRKALEILKDGTNEARQETHRRGN